MCLNQQTKRRQLADNCRRSPPLSLCLPSYPDSRQRALTNIVMAARTYLGIYLFQRTLRRGGDRRLDVVKRQKLKFASFWAGQVNLDKRTPRRQVLSRILTPFLSPPPFASISLPIQAAWVFLTSLPLLLVNGSRKHHPLSITNPFDVLGGLCIAVGLGWQITADLQKHQFRQNPLTANKFIDIGLWKYSRHPNVRCW